MKKQKEPDTVEAYGITFHKGVSAPVIELCMAFDVGSGVGSLHESKQFLGAFEHLRNAIDLIFNTKGNAFIWNEWTERMMRSFIEGREISLSGPGSSWKTTSMAVYALCFWFARPTQTRVIITSTTLDGLRARIWKEVLHFYRIAGKPFGNSVYHPHPKIQTVRGDDGTGIFGIAVEAGDVVKAVENIKGRHAPYTLVEVDEMTGVSAAIVDAGANLEKGTKRFQMIGSANPVSYFDQHGLFSEPENGWGSVSKETEKWVTKRGGIGIHLDGTLSPNVRAGKAQYPGMITLDDVELSRKRDGENSPKFWSQVIGWWPPEGLTKTVLTQSLIEKFHARDSCVWSGGFVQGAALDPAFEGGDRCVLRFAKCGRIDAALQKWTPNGLEDILTKKLMVVCFGEILILKIDVTSKEPHHYQIYRQVRDNCESRGIEPRYLAMDSSGEGGGLASIMKREWSFDFLEVEFGGMPSKRPISATNPRPGTEEYVNRVTELTYGFRYAVERGQIRGLDADTCKEFCSRQYEMQGPRIKVESKKDMKLRIGFSCDLEDAAVVMWELFRVRQPELAGGDVVSTDNRWKEFREKHSVFSEEDAYVEWNVG
jgi:hypothetical protein